MSNKLALAEMVQIGEILAQSRMFSDAKTSAQAITKILVGKEIGLSAIDSMTGISIIQGKPVVGAGLMAARIKANPKYDYDIITLDSKTCTIAFFENQEQERKKLGESTFTMQDAQNADLHKKQNWKSYPRNMLFARAMSNGTKWFCPDAFSGSFYTPEELGANVDSNGDIVNAEFVVEKPVDKKKDNKERLLQLQIEERYNSGKGVGEICLELGLPKPVVSRVVNNIELLEEGKQENETVENTMD